MAIALVSDIAALLPGAQKLRTTKAFTAAKGASAYESGWLTGLRPATGAAAPVYTNGSGYTCDRSTTGAIDLVNGATANRVARMIAHGNIGGTIYLCDRLWSCSNMGFAAGTYPVTTPGALPARITDGGLNCELWVEQFAAAGAASGTLTANYLDSAAGAKSGVISAVVSAPVIGQMQPVPLQDNLGISQLTSVTNSATWTSASWGMTIVKRLAAIPIEAAGYRRPIDWASLGLPLIHPDACLFLMLQATAGTALVLELTIDVIDA